MCIIADIYTIRIAWESIGTDQYYIAINLYYITYYILSSTPITCVYSFLRTRLLLCTVAVLFVYIHQSPVSFQFSFISSLSFSLVFLFMIYPSPLFPPPHWFFRLPLYSKRRKEHSSFVYILRHFPYFIQIHSASIHFAQLTIDYWQRLSIRSSVFLYSMWYTFIQTNNKWQN